MCERFFQLFEFLCRPMQFYPGEVGHGEHFREQRTDVFQMSENALGAFVSFTAANFVAIDAEAVEKIVFFGGSLLDELRKRRSDPPQVFLGAL